MIIVISPHHDFAESLRSATSDQLTIEQVGDESWASANVAQVAQQIAAMGPNAVIVGPDPYGIEPIALIRALDAQFVPAIIYCGPNDPDTILDVVRAGARDVVAADASEDELGDVVTRAIATGKARKGPAAVDDTPQSTISILSPKGGVGKTTIATNLAVGLARTNPGQVVLVDLDVQFGDVASSLGLNPEHTLADAARAYESLSTGTLKTYLTPHVSELYVLAGAASLVEAEQVDAVAVKSILTMLTESFPYVIIDTSSAVNDHTLSAFELSTDLLLLASTDVPGVRAMRRLLDALDAIGMTGQERHLVINRSTDRYGITVSDVEQTAGMEASAAIPAAKEVAISTNQGVPIIATAKRNPVLKALLPLVDSFDNHGNARAEDKKPFWKGG